MATWTRSVVSNLIHIYKNHECLWKVDTAEYKNKNKRLEAWSMITAELNSRCTLNVTSADVQKKINGLRTNYLKELKLVEGSKRSGGGEEDGIDTVYEPSWWAFYMLAFLKEFVKPITKGRSNLQLEKQVIQVVEKNNVVDIEFFDTEGNEIYDFDLQDGILSPSPCSSRTTSLPDVTASEERISAKRSRKSKSTRKSEIAVKLMNEAHNQLMNLNTANDNSHSDNYDIFGATVASELRLITNPGLLRKAKRDILSVIQDTQEQQEQIVMD